MRTIICGLLAVLFLLVALNQSVFAFPAALQVFYVPIPEDQAFTTFDAINPSVVSGNTVNYISIVPARTGTYVYYDQWENGYDSDIANPTSLYSASNLGGTQVWGDSNASNGCPPNINWVTIPCSDANDHLTAGAAIVLSSVVVPTSTGMAVIDFDGRDKIAATGPIAVTRTGWPETPGTVLASSTEVLPTQNWGTEYRVPVGENTPTGTTPASSLFSYSSIAIMASQNGTLVTIDLDGSGTVAAPFSITLNEGESYAVTGGVMEGASVQSDAPVQVNLMAGALGSAIRMDWFALYPTALWSNIYYNPVGTGSSAPTSLFFYNPGPSSMTVTCNYLSSSASRTIAGNDTASLTVPNNSGARCASTTGYPFFAIASVDTDADNVASDWGFTLVPDTLLTSQIFVGLGIGKDPASSSSENGSPIWITPACEGSTTSTYVYVDWNNDGTPDRADLNGDGDTSDTVNSISERNSNRGMLVQNFQSVRLYDAVDVGNNDQTGARIYTLTAADSGGTPGCSLTGAWGQDPSVASQGSPGLDLGTTMPPFPLLAGGKGTLLVADLDGDNIASPGDILEYTIIAQNVSLVSIANVIISDTVPLSTTYVANSTAIIMPTGPTTTTVADNTSGTAFPLDSGGINIGTLPPGEERKVNFHIKVDSGLQVCNIVLANTATVKSFFGFETPAASTPLCKPTIYKSASPEIVEAGTQITYTLAYTVSGHTPYSNLLISDTLPTGVSYVAGSASLTPTLLSGNLLQWNLGSVTPTVISNITYRGLLATTLVTGTQLVNRVTITDQFGIYDSSVVTTTAKSPLFDLALSKDDMLDPVGAGTRLTYTLSISNAGPSNATNVVITDTLPASATLVSASPSQSSGPNPLVWNLGTVTANTTSLITVAVTVSSNFTGTLTNTATLTTNIGIDTNPTNNRDAEATTVFVQADLTISKSDNVISYTAGLPITYAIVARNLGPATASSVLVSDTKPAQINRWTWNCTAQSGGASGCNGMVNSSSSFSDTITLPVGGAITYTVIATTTTSASDPLTNTAIITPLTAIFDPVLANNSATDIDNPNPLSDLRVTKSDTLDPVTAGRTLTYTIMLTNTGPSDAQNVVISDTLPAGLTFVSADPGCSYDNGVLTCAVGTIAANTTTTITVVVTVNSNYTQQPTIALWKPPPIDST